MESIQNLEKIKGYNRNRGKRRPENTPLYTHVSACVCVYISEVSRPIEGE